MKKSSLPKKQKDISPPSLGVTSLTANEKKVLNFIEVEILRSGSAPSYQEICQEFGFASYNSVQNYVKQLTRKGYLRSTPHQKRGLEVLKSATAFSVQTLDLVNKNATTESPQIGLLQGSVGIRPIPLLGSVAAGSPIERAEHDEALSVPMDLMKNPDQTFALRVSGDSMIDEGIYDRDTIVVLKQDFAKNGDLVVASIQGPAGQESTVKRIYYHPKHSSEKRVELRPANATHSSQWYPDHHVQIRGIVTGLLRKF
ncbi:MAG: transcriptional repressor LexA [Bdellovibrionales bacterium]